jgi:hypothetical protein
MVRTRKNDPARLAVAEREKNIGEIPWRSLGGAQLSEHLWEAQPGKSLEPGVHVIHIRAKDDWWVYQGRHIIHVR